jgi:hypothetical protein
LSLASSRRGVTVGQKFGVKESMLGQAMRSFPDEGIVPL